MDDRKFPGFKSDSNGIQAMLSCPHHPLSPTKKSDDWQKFYLVVDESVSDELSVPVESIDRSVSRPVALRMKWRLYARCDVKAEISK